MDVNEENISELAPKIMAMLEQWKLSPEYVVRMLGLEGMVKPRDLTSFRNKSKAFPYSVEIAERFEQIDGIHEALHTTHPHSMDARRLWLRRPHRRFNKVSPMAIMLADGLDGMIRVHIELDCAYGWSLTENNPKT